MNLRASQVKIMVEIPCPECKGRGSTVHPEWNRWWESEYRPGGSQAMAYARWLTHVAGYLYKSEAFNAALSGVEAGPPRQRCGECEAKGRVRALMPLCELKALLEAEDADQTLEMEWPQILSA